MSSRARIGLVVATLVAIVVAFVVLSPGDEGPDTESTTTPAAAATTTSASRSGQEPPSSVQPRAELRPVPTFTTIRVRGGKPVGGIRTINVVKGNRARIEVSSPDTSDEVHLHGYDVSRDLRAGGRVRFSFEANADGIFEIELEGSHTQIGKLVVEP